MDPEQPISKEQQEAEDAATFGMDGVASQGEVSVEVTRSNTRKFAMTWLVVFGASILSLLCLITIALGLILWKYSQTPQVAENPKEKQLPPAKELKARIKAIDRDARSLKLLVGDGKYQTFTIDASTEFRDQAGQRLGKGLDSPELREEETVTILTTDDRKTLRWLKLGAP